MNYKYGEKVGGSLGEKITIIAVALLFTVMATTIVLAPAEAKSKTSNNAGTIGQVTFDTNVLDDGSGEMLYGSGIPNGEWVVAETQGVELGVRITDRTDGTLDVSGDKGDRVGVYEAHTGFDGNTTNRAEWNYEWSVNLTDAKGASEGKTLDDYTLVMEQDYSSQIPSSVELPMPDSCLDGYTDSDVVCQQSWNPTFFNGDFEPEDEGVYNLRFVLTPNKNGPPVAVSVQVNVVNP